MPWIRILSGPVSVLVMSAPAIAVPLPLLRSEPTVVQCPYCGRTNPTVIEYKAGLLAYLSCIGMIVGGCSCGCCLIPFCMDKTRDVQHRCSACRQVLHTYERL